MEVDQKLKAKIVRKTAQAIREFGYEDCTEENLLTTPIYSMAAMELLEEVYNPNSGNAWTVYSIIQEAEQCAAKFGVKEE